MAIAPRGFLVKSPSCDNPPEYSLLASVEVQTINDPHWQASGIEWEDFLCGEGLAAFVDLCPSGVIPPSGVAPNDFVKPAQRSTQFCAADPFIVVGSYQCPPVGRPMGEAFEIARKRLLVWESHQVEETFWTGVVANGTGLISPSLAFGNPDCGIVPTDINPAGALTPVRAISALESALGDIVACGATIHVPYQLVAYLAEAHLLVEEDGIWYTPSGTKIIAGNGYPGSGPANVAAAAGEVWIFGTGPVILVRGNVIQVPDNMGQAVDRNINNVTVRAERFYAVGFSCVDLAVRVTLCNVC